MARKRHSTVIPIGGYVGAREFNNAGVRISLATSAAASAAIDAYLVDLVADVACFITIGPLATVPPAVVDAGYYLSPNVPYRMPIEAGDIVTGIVASGTGNLWVHPVKGDIDSEV